MAVSSHLKIALHEYDARIRTFIPDYEEMLEVAASALVAAARPVRTVVDLGTGTGALVARVASVVPDAAIVGVDEDLGMLRMAERRLKTHRVTLVTGDFVRWDLPGCDAITASFALHHIEHRRTRKALYARARLSLRRGGVLVSADCHPAANPALAAAGRRAWHAHLAGRYGPRKAESFLRAWAAEDFYEPLDSELGLMQAAGFQTDVVWRRGAFAVIAATACRRR
ncbi:MAG: class I SAM-dependent methyltransferase [Acidobacteriota bacterium]|nr:class I SAM-dependent methyltransferase [Acidobacteriota bacterium]